jgi:hypothetical protein
MRDIEIVIWESFSETDRRIATVKVRKNGGITAIDSVRNRKTVAKVRARIELESVWRLVERTAAALARSDEIGG